MPLDTANDMHIRLHLNIQNYDNVYNRAGPCIGSIVICRPCRPMGTIWMRMWSGGSNPGHARGPLHDHDPALVEQFGKPDGLEIVLAMNAIGVEMKERQAARVIDMQQHIGRAADRSRIAAEPFEQAANELRFPRAKIAVQGDALPRRQRQRELGGDGLGLIGTM